MLIAGSIWAAFLVFFAVIAAILMHRYVVLFRNGRKAVAEVISENHVPGGGRMVVVRYRHSSGETRFSVVPKSQLAVGAQTTTIVGPPKTKLVLVGNGAVGYARGSALTSGEVAQVLSRYPGADSSRRFE